SDTFECSRLTAAAATLTEVSAAGLATSCTACTALPYTTTLPACARHARRRLPSASGESPAALLTAEAALLLRATAERLTALRVPRTGLVVALLRAGIAVLHALAMLWVVLPVASPATTVATATVATACLSPVALVALGPISRSVTV